MNRRNLEALEESLHQAKSSKLSNKLQTLIHKAEAEVADLKKLDKHAHDILDMNLVTVTELRNYKTPKPIVHDVMKATFLLLGEREDYLEVKLIVKFCLFVCLFGLYRPIREFFTHMETPPLPVKGYKF